MLRHMKSGIATFRRMVPVVAAALILSPPAPAGAQWENRIGIFASPTDMVTQMMLPPGVLAQIYFVLISPRDADGQAVTAVDGFEYQVTIEGPPGMLLRLADQTPPGWYTNRDVSNWYDAGYQVAGGTPLPVVDDLVVLQSWTIMVLSQQDFYFYLGPIFQPTIYGSLAYTWPGPGGSVAVAATPASFADWDPVFCVNCFMIDPVVKHTFGEIKALYR